jgi:hypothetical protein
MPARFVATALLLAAFACSTPPVSGRYYQGLTWIEFKGAGIVLHGGLGDTARFDIDSQDKTKLAIFDRRGQTVGRIMGPTTLEFPSGDSSIAQAFQGRWAKEEAPTTTATAEDKARDAAAIAGGWRIPGETHVLDFHADGARWTEITDDVRSERAAVRLSGSAIRCRERRTATDGAGWRGDEVRPREVICTAFPAGTTGSRPPQGVIHTTAPRVEKRHRADLVSLPRHQRAAEPGRLAETLLARFLPYECPR